MKTIEVFGVSNEEIASYIERKQVDERFQEGLQRNKHIIVFGASKQGKTALTNKHLKPSDFIRINCSPQTRVIDIYKSILRQLNIEFKEETSKKNLIEASAKGELKAKVTIPLLGNTEASTEVDGRVLKEDSIKWKTVEYNLALPQDISEILKSVRFNKRIIIETGLTRKFMHDEIKKIHHRQDDVRASDMSYFLHNIVQSQIKKDIQPPLFDYDQSTRTIKIIDSTLYFFLKNADKEEIISEFGTPDGI